MTDLEKIDKRIDRAIRKRDELRDKAQLVSRQIHNRDRYIAELGRMRSKLANQNLELTADEPKGKMRSKEKLQRYRAGLTKYFKDLAASKILSNNVAPPIHFPVRADYEIRDAAEIFLAEKIESELIPQGFKPAGAPLV